MDGLWRCSEWKKPHLRAPVVSTSGYFSASSGADTGLSGGSSYVANGEKPKWAISAQ